MLNNSISRELAMSVVKNSDDDKPKKPKGKGGRSHKSK